MANVDLKTNFKNGDKLYDYELNNNFKAIKAALEAMNKIVWQNDDNASLVMFAGTTEQITNRELIEGQLLYNTQTGETYIDAMVDTELKRISTGGGTSIQIGGIEPTNPATKLWVEDDMLTNLGTEIESGSNENGSYIKFADGTMICSRRKTIYTPITNTWGSLKISTMLDEFVYPIPFIKRPHTTISVESNKSAWIVCSGNGSISKPMPIHLVAAEAVNSDYFDIEYIAIGRWKA